jgi:hypothetical protein
MPFGPREADAKKAEAERLGSLAAKYESVRIAGKTTGTSKSLVYLVLLSAAVAVVILAIVLS